MLCIYADNLYTKKEYSSAYSIYDVICTYKPENTEYQYKLTKCLLKMPFSYSVQKKLIEIAQKDDNSSAEKLATKNILKTRQKIYKKYGETYIEDAVNNGIILRWSKKSFPLKYYIEPSNIVPDYYFKETENAFQDWQRESDNFIKFIPVQNEINADISIKFRTILTENLNNKENYKAAITTPVIENENLLKKMEISCTIKTHEYEFFTPKQIKKIMEHEIGHALGIWGHPKDNQSIMYYSLDNPYDYYEKRIDTAIISKDIKTIKLLYILAPDITNNINDLANKEQFLYLPLLLYPLDNSQEELILKAQEMLKEHPDDLGYALTLADTYNANGKYKESIYLMKFLTMQTNNTKLLNILNYNIANNYISLKDFDNALLYAQKALIYSKAIDNRILVAYIKYCKGDLEKAEKEFLLILENNPSFTNASLGLADIYIKQKKYIKARKVLKELLEHNPHALDDKSLNTYKMLTVF
ncbi:tetratricopeptide repeat protein [bacterium]|nr:tetratricopeptide repeat protein [bacterium]